MRQIFADCIFPVSSPPVVNGILRLTDDAEVIDILKPEDDAYDLSAAEIHEGWLIPGLVNAHCHVELSHLQNTVKEHTGLDGFLEELMLVREADESTIKQAIEEADATMWKNGIVAVGDISNGTASFATKNNSPIRYHTFIELYGLNASNAEYIFSTGESLFDELSKNQRNFSGNINPHAPYSVSNPLMELISKHVIASNGVFSIHNQETQSEDDFFKLGEGIMVNRMKKMGIDLSSFSPTGKSSIQSLLNPMSSQNKVLLVHNTFSSESDIIAAEAILENVYWCFCPSANLYIENRLPSIELFRKNTNKLVIGTDSLASNHQLDLIREMYVLQSYFNDLTCEELIEWGTIRGAEILGFDNDLGSFSVGKKPGCVLIKHVDKKRAKFLPESYALMI
jgi:cytosine/adenosine deaminase-related metal-dependent hydrolase